MRQKRGMSACCTTKQQHTQPPPPKTNDCRHNTQSKMLIAARAQTSKPLILSKFRTSSSMVEYIELN